MTEKTNEDLLIEILKLESEVTKKINGLQRGTIESTDKKQKKLIEQLARNLDLDIEYIQENRV